LSGRKKVTVVHKANIMKLVDGLFINTAKEVAKDYPFIKYEEMIVDNASMQVLLLLFSLLKLQLNSM
jgi:isocitrate dehydrogenase (NAD+)